MRGLIISRQTFLLVAAAMAFLFLTGCVTKSSYNKVVEERNQLRVQNAALEGDTIDLSTELRSIVSPSSAAFCSRS